METTDDTRTSVTGSITSDNTWSTLKTYEQEEEASPLTWRPPDLQPGHPWYNARVTNLMEATKELPNCDEIRRQGIEALSIHRQNYDEFGPKPKTLQLLWWEFPPEH
jgi:hypothetical protein